MKIISQYFNIGKSREFEKKALNFEKNLNKLNFTDYLISNETNAMNSFSKKRMPKVIPRRWNNRYIPTFILNTIQQYKVDVLYVHIDGVFRFIPDIEMFDDYDICVSKGKDLSLVKDNILMSPVFFRYSDYSIKFIEEWIELCKVRTENWTEHDYFKELIESGRYRHKVIEGLGSRNPRCETAFHF
jgi:hypothetical protein